MIQTGIYKYIDIYMYTIDVIHNIMQNVIYNMMQYNIIQHIIV